MVYKELKEKLDKLNFDNSHFINSNDICTPMDCVEEMTDAIPEEFWKREGLNILDPCTGNGNFPSYVLEKLRINENKSYTLTANEINPKRIENLKYLIGDEVNIEQMDFFDFPDEEKYDLIIANPPYAKISIEGLRAAKNHNLSRAFVVNFY